MLINNKSLIKTINKLNLTDDEREKFNKISEDDRGNFLYNGKPVTGGATEAQATQIEANKTAIGDENSGLIKEVNDLTESLTNIDADTLNGKKFSDPITKAQFEAITDKDPNTIYLISDESNTITSIPDFTSADANKVLAVNADGTSLGWVNTPSGDTSSSITVIDNLTSASTTNALSANQGKILDEKISNLTVGNISGYVKNPFYNKKGVALGDSITHGGSYMNTVKNNLGMASYENLGRSGATVSLAESDNNLINVVDGLDSSANYDLISIMIGTNDICIKGVPIGEINDTSKYTFLGAYRYCLETLMSKFPNAKIVVLTSPRLVGDNDYEAQFQGGFRQHDYAFAVKQLCYELTIPVLDVFSSSLNCVQNKTTTYRNNGTDGIHLSGNGQDNIALMLTGFLTSLASENNSYIVKGLIEKINDLECNMSNMINTNNSLHHYRDWVEFDTSMLDEASIKSDETVDYIEQEVIFNNGVVESMKNSHAILSENLFTDLEVNYLKGGYGAVIIGVKETDVRNVLMLHLKSTSYMGKVSVLSDNNSLSGMTQADPNSIYMSCRAARVAIRGDVVSVYVKSSYGLLTKIFEANIPSSFTGYIPALGVLGVEKSVRVKYGIDPTEATAITISNSVDELLVNGTCQLNVSYTPSNANFNTKITWSSNNDSIATVSNNGLVKGVSAGEVTITATTKNNISNSVNITIVEPSSEQIEPTSISLSESAMTLNKGASRNLTVNYIPVTANTNTEITWSSSNSNCTVTNGLVVAQAVGESIITATTANNKSATCTVTINENVAGNYTTDGLIRDYSFANLSNDGSVTSVADKTGNGGNVELKNTLFDETSGFNNNMLYISEGTDYAEITNFGLDSSSDWSLEMVCSFPSVASNSVNDARIGSYGQWGNSVYSGGFGSYVLALKENDASAQGIVVSISCQANEIHHIVYTHDKNGKHIDAYVDGTKNSGADYSCEALANISTLRLGDKADASTRGGYPGKIGMLRLYNKVLTADEIKKNNDYEATITRA